MKGCLDLKALCLLVVITFISFVHMFTHDLLSTSHISDVTYTISFTPHHNPMRVSIFTSPLLKQRNQCSKVVTSKRPTSERWSLASAPEPRPYTSLSFPLLSVPFSHLSQITMASAFADSKIKPYNQWILTFSSKELNTRAHFKSYTSYSCKLAVTKVGFTTNKALCEIPWGKVSCLNVYFTSY